MTLSYSISQLKEIIMTGPNIEGRHTRWSLSGQMYCKYFYFRNHYYHIKLDMDSSRKQEALSEHSRVSSNSSQGEENYELMPNNQPITRPKQDLPSTRLSNPFKKITNPKPHSNHDECHLAIKEKERQLQQLRAQLLRIKEDYELQGKANEIYSQSFERLKQLAKRFLGESESGNLEQLIEKLFQTFIANMQTIEKQEVKINRLKEQLLKSTQNNIHAIFQHKFTPDHCVHIQLQNAEQQIQSLVTGYQSLKEEYSKLDNALKQMNSHKSIDHQESFEHLKRDITESIKNQLSEAKEIIKRPSSNHEQVIIAKDIENKLNDLINTLYAPQKATLEGKQEEEYTPQVKDMEMMRKIGLLQMRNSKLEKDIALITQEKNYLQEKILNLSKYKQVRGKELVHNPFNHNPLEIKRNVQYPHRKEDFYEEVIFTSRSDRDQQKILEQLSHGESYANMVHTSSLNRHQNSMSHHQSSPKNTELQTLYTKIQKYEQLIQSKEMRIIELQNTIIDHIESRSAPSHNFVNQQDVKERYQTYINNLKVLLNESRKEYEILKREFIKVNEMSLSRLNEDIKSISLSVSDKTTKNNIAQTRLIQRRPLKNNTYETIKAKLQVEELIEKAFFSLLQLAEKVLLYQQIQRESAMDIVIVCMKELILELKERNCRLYDEINGNQQLKGKLINFGIQLI